MMKTDALFLTICSFVSNIKIGQPTVWQNPKLCGTRQMCHTPRNMWAKPPMFHWYVESTRLFGIYEGAVNTRGKDNQILHKQHQGLFVSAVSTSENYFMTRFSGTEKFCTNF